MNGKANIRPKLIVMPIQPDAGQPFDGAGLGCHFFLGNLFAAHPRLSECWFGWRVKKIFPRTPELLDYCRGKGPALDFISLGSREKVRYWLEGCYGWEADGLRLALTLHDSREGTVAAVAFTTPVHDGFMAFRQVFFEWLGQEGLSFENPSAVLWPEPLSRQGLDCLGRAVETIYSNYVGPSGPEPALIDLSWFDRAAEASPDSYLAQDLKGWGLLKNQSCQEAETAFETALSLNDKGVGALAGMMWCAIHGRDGQKALQYSLAKAGIRKDDPEKARQLVENKLKT